MQVFLLTCLRESVDNWQGGVDASVEAYVFPTKEEAMFYAIRKYIQNFEDLKGYEETDEIDDMPQSEWLKPNQSSSMLTRRLRRMEDAWSSADDDGHTIRMSIWEQTLNPYIEQTSITYGKSQKKSARKFYYQYVKKRIAPKPGGV